MRIVSIIGARPQFVKAAMICRAVPAFAGRIDHRIVHTGQHYDATMSAVFFEELEIPAPDHHLEVGSGSHGLQTGEMLKRIEPALQADRPDWVVLYGDTNSTLAGAVAASKLGIAVAHVEAGLRSYNRRMPEELNRVAADHLSDLLFCPTAAAMENLAREGLASRALMTGDVMYDAAIAFRRVAESRGSPLADEWRPGAFALASVHRAENTDDPQRLRAILEALDRLAAEQCPVALPLHPRTAAKLRESGWKPRALALLPPVSYLDMLLLEGRARFILTDSGGVQKEAYFARVPCITIREETEWVETLAHGCNVLTGPHPERILAAAARAANAGPWEDLYGNGAAAETMLRALLEHPQIRPAFSIGVPRL
jgi:UDP-GlcNAc3NAcA epimerase